MSAVDRIPTASDAPATSGSTAPRWRYPRWRALRRGHTWFIVITTIILALGLFVALGVAAHTAGAHLLPGDALITRELQESRNPIVFWLLYTVSLIGFNPWNTFIWALALAGLIICRLPLEAFFLALTFLADTLGGAIKLLVGRPRPSASLVHVVQQIGGYSFPSGHTIHYVAFFGFLAFVLGVNARPSWWRNLLIAICVILIALVGPSRVYLGEHWPTDVLGGYLLGGLCLLATIAAYLWVRKRLGHNGQLAHRPSATSSSTHAA